MHHSRGSAEGRREHRSEHHENVRAEHGEENAEAPVLEEPRDCAGILEIMQDGFGFIRSDNYLPGDNDVYVAPLQIRKLNLKTGDILVGKTRRNNPTDKFGALVHLETINGFAPEEAAKRKNFEDLTPIFPNERIRLEQPGSSVAMRIVDLVSPIGKGQRGMIVSQPKAGKTTLLKEIAKSVCSIRPTACRTWPKSSVSLTRLLSASFSNATAECRPASLRNKPKPYLKVHLRYHLSVEEINDTVSKTGIMLRVGHHHNGGAFLMQLGK